MPRESSSFLAFLVHFLPVDRICPAAADEDILGNRKFRAKRYLLINGAYADLLSLLRRTYLNSLVVP